MKKTVYIQPNAEWILLNDADVIQTSSIEDSNPIKRLTNDAGSNGLPSVDWKNA